MTWGAEKSTDWTVAKLTQIIDERIRNGKRTVITTNAFLGQMAKTASYRTADRIFDDKTGSVEVVTLTCGSYRTGRK